ncbi:hypothetical protein EAF00_005355 [Botryotinia globosa]|nr:hypothetical protein EAF00_005355 [Botryotinia globosa]
MFPGPRLNEAKPPLACHETHNPVTLSESLRTISIYIPLLIFPSIANCVADKYKQSRLKPQQTHQRLIRNTSQKEFAEECAPCFDSSTAIADLCSR